jgi:hypothetical protein
MFVGLLLAAALVAGPPRGGVLAGEEAAYQAMLAARARAANNAFMNAACDDAKVETIAIQPWRIVDRPDLIVWRARVSVTGCGHSAVENVNIGRLDGSPPWRMTTGLPGTTLADMNLQEHTLPAAVAQARAGLPADCQPVSLNDVYLAARPGDVDLSAPGAPRPKPRVGHPGIALPDAAGPADKLALSEAWMEVWPFNVCGHDRTLGVVFIPLKNHTESLHVFLPIWQQIEAHGPGAGPAPVSIDNPG